MFVLKPDNEFYRKQAKEEELRRIKERIDGINELRRKKDEQMKVIVFMSHIEKLLSISGGEPKANFLEVRADLVKIGTRIPMKVNIFPFLPDNEQNPRFHKIITEVLMEMKVVSGVRWVPQSGGVVLVVGLVT